MSDHEQTAKEISKFLPTFLRHMFPYIFSPMKVPPSQVLALISIHERGGCTLSELRKEMHVSAPTVSGIIDRLVRDNYVIRTIDENDRRVKNVVLTKKGQGVVEKFRENIRKRWSYILSKESVDMAPMLKVMRKITQGFIDGKI